MLDLITTPVFKKVGNYSKVLIDADLISFSCAAASDGSYYAVEENYFDEYNNEFSSEEVCRFRYKKELDEYLKEHPLEPDQWVRHDYDPESLDTCLHSVKMLTSSIIEACGGGEYKLFLTGKNNYRMKINPLYKANRIGIRRPYHLESCRKYLVEQFGAQIIEGAEADDAIGWSQTFTSIIASNDKDLDTISGYHYNWNKGEVYLVTEEEARLNLYAQILSGDRTDNVEGIYGVAKKTANALLNTAKSTSKHDLYDRCIQVYQQYKNPLREGFRSQVEWAKKRVLKVARQVYILREDGVMWNPPV